VDASGKGRIWKGTERIILLKQTVRRILLAL
jgi:hypothetical protein